MSDTEKPRMVIDKCKNCGCSKESHSIEPPYECQSGHPGQPDFDDSYGMCDCTGFKYERKVMVELTREQLRRLYYGAVNAQECCECDQSLWKEEHAADCWIGKSLRALEGEDKLWPKCDYTDNPALYSLQLCRCGTCQLFRTQIGAYLDSYMMLLTEVRYALKEANGRWEEWRVRAERVEEILEGALEERLAVLKEAKRTRG